MKMLENKPISNRIVAIDILRCLAIMGMILSAEILLGRSLPAWMFHAQVPPPDFTFRPDVPGITWVDLVFPFFIFSMGAAFPLSLSKKVAKGDSIWKIVLGLFHRWVFLSVFSILLGNAYILHSAGLAPRMAALFRIMIFIGFFLWLTDLRIEKKAIRLSVSILGFVLLVGCLAIEAFVLKLPVGLNNFDIIITILANVAFVGGLMWLVTRNSLRLRWIVILFIIAIKALSSYTNIFSFIPPSPTGLVSFSYLQYLVIVGVGSIVGDMILKNYTKGEEITGEKNPSRTLGTIACGIAFLAVILQLWGLFTRHLVADSVISCIIAVIFYLMTRGNRRLWSDATILGFAVMLCGIIFDPIDGGITKDYCNLSYLLTTAGMAAMTTGVLLFLEKEYGCRGGALAGCGQNPMIAYTVTGFLIGPLLSLIGLMTPLNAIASGSAFWALLRGVILTAFAVATTHFFTRLKIYWKS